MRTIHAAQTSFEAHLVANILRDAGLEVLIEGEPLQGALGDLPLDPSTMPKVAVLRDDDYARAMAVLAEHRREHAGRGEDEEPGT